MVDKENLARRLEPLADQVAAMVRSPKSDVERLDTAFLSDGAIYRVIYFGAARPVGITIGCAGPDFTVLLPANPAGYMELARRGGLRLDSAEHRLRYAVVFLESTRDFSERFQILRGAGDIELVPSASAEEQERYRQLQDTYRAVIRPPQLSETWEVSAFALVGQDLVRITVKIGPDGTIQRSDAVLEKALPIALAL